MAREKKVVFSVIMPIYNAEKYLDKSVKSILNQSFSNMEVILVNDGSTDESGIICEKYQALDQRVCYICKENGGHTSARNAGLSIARGEYIIFIDSDDWFEGELFQESYEVIEKYRPDIVLFGHKKVSENAEEYKLQPYSAGVYDRQRIMSEILPTLLTNGRFSLWDRITKRELLMEHQKVVDTTIKMGEDLLCCVCALAKATSVSVLDKAYYNYYQHQDSFAHSFKNYNFSDWGKIRKILCEKISEEVPQFYQQLGCCSIRFLDRAVLGTIEREGISLRTRKNINQELNLFEQDIRNTNKKALGKALRFKNFCLRNRAIFMLYFSSVLVRKIRQIRRGS